MQNAEMENDVMKENVILAKMYIAFKEATKKEESRNNFCIINNV